MRRDRELRCLRESETCLDFIVCIGKLPHLILLWILGLTAIIGLMLVPIP